MQEKLENLRKKIDETDENILKLLAERFEIVKKIGAYKKLKKIPVLDEKRREEVINSKVLLGKKMGLDKQFIEKIWNTFHDEAIQLEQ